MAIIEITKDKSDCIVKYVESALTHVRMVEHKLTEVLECLDSENNN